GVLPSRRSRSGAGGSLPLSSCYPSRRAPHSFPTRRSSDLGVAERIDLGGELRQALVDLLDDLAKLLVLLCLFLSELFRIEVDLRDRKSTRLNSSHVEISYAVFFLEKRKNLDASEFGHPDSQ